MRPFTEKEKIAALQQETTEAKKIILEGNLSLKGCGDLLPLLKRAARGGILRPAELKEIEVFLKALEGVKKFFLERETEERFPRISVIVRQISLFPHLVKELENCLTQEGEIKDSASKELFSLRTEEKNLEEKIHRTLESYLKNPQHLKYLQESIITVRHHRYVLPVKQQFRRQIPGVVHDQSASGATLFVEPLQVFELNNRLQEIKGRINEEIEKILRRLTALIGSHWKGILFGYEAYGELDFIMARGRLSLLYKAEEPLLNDRGVIFISKGRHPLLPAEEVVPLDVHLGQNFHTLVITGPNTGGKTVALKTIGLLALMSQCGLHVPAERGTDLCVFDSIWADIGDEQNIEQSLSTFSGHILNIVDILSKAAPPSLVLLDELGAGTDPSEGAALAMALLEELHSRNLRTVATTHINELKVFAHLREGMENACMEFDPLTLKPSFKLLIGIPGQSNALVVAERLGMPREIIERARSYMHKELLNLEEAVSGLLDEKRKLSEAHERMKEKQRELDRLYHNLTAEKEMLEQKRKELLQKARQEAAEIIKDARRRTEEILTRLNHLQQEKAAKEALLFGHQAKKSFQVLQEEIEGNEFKDAKVEGLTLTMEEAKADRQVYIKSLKCRGSIIKAYSPQEIHVQAGMLKICTDLNDLRKFPEEKENQTKGSPAGKEQSYKDLLWEKSAHTLRKLDLRGLTLDEAIIRLEKHMDDSILANLDSIQIIHGKGTGKLRKGLHQYLEKKEQVESFRLGVEGEGGSGVTIVNLKKT